MLIVNISYLLKYSLGNIQKEEAKAVKPIRTNTVFAPKAMGDEVHNPLVAPPAQFMDGGTDSRITASNNIRPISLQNKSTLNSCSTLETNQTYSPFKLSDTEEVDINVLEEKQETASQKTRGDFIEDIINGTVITPDDDAKDMFEMYRMKRKSNISKLEAVTQELYLTLLNKMELMREEESCLEQENQENEDKWENLQERFGELIINLAYFNGFG